MTGRLRLDRSSIKWSAASKRFRAEACFFIFTIFFIVSGVQQLPRVPRDGVWQRVSATRSKFYVFSAYVERRSAVVRVIAATKLKDADPVFCRLWLANRTVTLSAKIKPIPENWNLKYGSVFVLCLLGDARVRLQETVGAAVSVMGRAAAPDMSPTNLLPVLDTEPRSGIEESVHICVKPFHSSFSSYEWMIEWFEIQRLLGVNHFYMYNYSMDHATTCVLNHYKRLNLVTLLSWKLPFISKVEIRTAGMFSAFNDCLYRSMRTAGWLLVIDVDEVVIPRRKRTLPAMLTEFMSIAKSKINPAAFLFRNVFFYMSWEDDSLATTSLITERKTRRQKNPHPLRKRSKYAVRPREAIQLGNHFLWKHAPNATSIGARPNQALVHHYRKSCDIDKCLSVSSTIDRTAHRWSSELMQHVVAEKELIDQSCPGQASTTESTAQPTPQLSTQPKG